jgi:predicted AlkP superfamily phosphohydrolase/phosphomutase
MSRFPSHPRYDPEEVKRIHERIDDCIGQMLERLDDDTTSLVMSRHGFGPFHRTVTCEWGCASEEGALSADEIAEVEERLRSLGCLG